MSAGRLSEPDVVAASAVPDQEHAVRGDVIEYGDQVTVPD
jgi:hypothetical protein